MSSISLSLFARHKDIDRASALLSGTSWHIDASHQNKRKTNRPDKKRCKYYDKNKKMCHRDKRYTICISSSECGCYREK